MVGKKKIILVVDDASTNLQIVYNTLNKEFDVRLAKSGSIALIELSRTVPDLILLDIEMPRISGFDVLKSIQDNPKLRSIPVVFLTSHAEMNTVMTALQQKGVKDYIVKPFEPEDLRGRVHKALGIK
ncbi:MAG: response regulator [Synergistaceae bacterium]|jgi:putative two-component system response regulator|nr:response regulator [Synergistaceae bacterium]